MAAERVTGAIVTANTFSLLGTRPLVGRAFSEEDEQPNAALVALISYGLWQARYGGDEHILGKVIRVNLVEHTVIGVMQPGEGFPQNTSLWVPFVPGKAIERRDARSLLGFGRLNRGVSFEQAAAELHNIAGALAATYPDTNAGIDVDVGPYTDRGTVGPIRTILYTMLGAVAFVLLIACANVANLLLSRAIWRMRETSIRTALGASRWRIIRQLLIESVMMSVVGGALGLGVTLFALRWFDAATLPTGRPYWLDFTMDYRVFAYFTAVSVLTGILFGLAPALHISRLNVNENLREAGRGAAGAARVGKMTTALLVGQIALTIVLLVGAGLLLRSLANVNQLNVGVDTRDLVTMQVAPSQSRYPQPEDRLRFEEDLAERLAALPGIEAVTMSSFPPAAGAQFRAMKIEGREITDSNDRLPIVGTLSVAPGYFNALQLTIGPGRPFMATDGSPGAEAAIVNEPFVAQYFAGQDPIGKRLRLGSDLTRGVDDPTAPWLTIVGVSPPVFQWSQNQDLKIRPTVYVPFRQESPPAFTILVRTGAPLAGVAAAIRSELGRVDADLPLYDIRSMDDILSQRTWGERIFGTLFTVFAVIALLMSAMGIYAMTAYGVGQRTQEIGLRMALGAARRDILWLVLRQGITRVALGSVVGLVAALAVSRVLQSGLTEVTATDPITYVSISVILAAATLVACLVPARRATLLDPMGALRTE